LELRRLQLRPLKLRPLHLRSLKLRALHLWTLELWALHLRALKLRALELWALHLRRLKLGSLILWRLELRRLHLRRLILRSVHRRRLELLRVCLRRLRTSPRCLADRSAEHLRKTAGPRNGLTDGWCWRRRGWIGHSRNIRSRHWRCAEDPGEIARRLRRSTSRAWARRRWRREGAAGRRSRSGLK